MSRDFLIHMDFVLSKMSSPHVDVQVPAAPRHPSFWIFCRLLDHQIPLDKNTVKDGRWYFFSVMCLWSFLLVNLAVICRLWSLRKRRSWSWRDVSSHRADAAEHPIIAPSPGPVGVWVRKPGTNKDDQVEIEERKNLALLGYRKSKTRQRCWQNQWISMRPLFFALVFTVKFIHFCISIAFSLPFLRHLFEPFFRGSFRQEDEVESSTDDESPQVRELWEHPVGNMWAS